MDRKGFIKMCGGACLGVTGLAVLLQSCATSYVTGTVTGDRLQLRKSDFIKIKNDKTTVRRYVLVKPEKLDFPVIVYRNSDNTFTALLLRCTHQGSELTVNGDILTCSAHGSEFGRKGEVIQGPAEQQLKNFPVTTDEQNIYIQLT